MPLPDALLEKPLNAHLLRPAGETVFDALRAWRAAAGSASWWWLVIDHGRGRFRAARFETLRQMLARPDLGVTMETPLADLPLQREPAAGQAEPPPGVIAPSAVEQGATSPAQARQLQAAHPAGLLIVLHNGAFRGILASTERTFAFTDRPLLDMLEQYEQRAAGSGDTAGSAGTAPELPRS